MKSIFDTFKKPKIPHFGYKTWAGGVDEPLITHNITSIRERPDGTNLFDITIERGTTVKQVTFPMEELIRIGFFNLDTLKIPW